MSDDAAYVRHVLDAIERIEAYTDGVAEREFEDEPMIQDAVIRQLEVLGDAATRTSAGTRRRHDDVPWRDVTGTRNEPVGGYSGVDVDIVRETVVEDVPQSRVPIGPSDPRYATFVTDEAPRVATSSSATSGESRDRRAVSRLGDLHRDHHRRRPVA